MIVLGEVVYVEGIVIIVNGFFFYVEGYYILIVYFVGSYIMGCFGIVEEVYFWFIVNGVSDIDYNIGVKWFVYNGEMYIEGVFYNVSGMDFV